jgi:hypothetical protein
MLIVDSTYFVWLKEKLWLMQLIKKGFDKVSESVKSPNGKKNPSIVALYNSNAFP